MGEYYDWVNIDKRQYISPSDFGFGSKLHESAVAGNAFLGALYNLLASDWKGDCIVFLGDETNIPDEMTNPTLLKLHAERNIWGEAGYEADYVYEMYKSVSGLFVDAEKEVRPEIEYMLKNNDFQINPYGINIENPYEGLFVRKAQHFRFTINHSKKEFFDIEKTRITYIEHGEVPTLRINPLPLLMAYPGTEEDMCTGLWLGNQIEVSNEYPANDYLDMSDKYCWERYK